MADKEVTSDPFEEQGDSSDPFHPDNIGAVQLITQLRIYDVLMALLRERDEDVARDLLQLHMEGNIVGSSPWLNGNFLTDLANATDIED